MSFDTDQMRDLVRIDVVTLESWVEVGWLLPEGTPPARRFTQVDVARAQLIQDLREAMGVNDEGVSVILELVDQIHGLRRALHGVRAAGPGG
jgi:chaperone modulatory protein CbpM